MAPGGLRLALAGGGTGGHIVPGLHVLEHFRAQGTALADLLWLSAGRTVEERFLDGLPARFALPVERVALALEPREQHAPSWMRLVSRTPPELARARAAFARHRSQVLLALGGYTVLPAVLAARTLGIPVVLLEINAVAGKATRSLAGLAERVVHAWPSSLPRSRAARHRCLGPPLAPEFLAGEPTDAESARAREDLGFAPDRPLLAVLGGSQGALALNRFVASHARELLAAGLQVLHQTGPGRLGEGAEAREGYRSVEHVTEVARVLTAATLVLCRGGASTLAEIAARARPAIVVPYPHHRDRHQEVNARVLGAGVKVVPEPRLDSELARELARLAGPRGESERAAMSRAIHQAVPRDGGARLAQELLCAARGFAEKTWNAPGGGLE